MEQHTFIEYQLYIQHHYNSLHLIFTTICRKLPYNLFTGEKVETVFILMLHFNKNKIILGYFTL